jgi:hypothetical protein
VNPDDARRKGMSEDDYAGSVASTWKNGLMGGASARPDFPSCERRWTTQSTHPVLMRDFP